MLDYTKTWINIDFYNVLQNGDPQNFFKISEPIGDGHAGQVFKALPTVNIPNLAEYYALKCQPLSKRSECELRILEELQEYTDWFPFLYCRYIIDSTQYFLLHPGMYTLGTVLATSNLKFDFYWWVTLLHQISSAVEILESLEINHNDITFENIMFKTISSDYQRFKIMLIDFGSCVKGHKADNGLPAFNLGRDLNYFLFILIFNGTPAGYFPQELGERLRPFLKLKPGKCDCKGGCTNLKCIQRANISEHNWRTSGKHVREWLEKMYPSVNNDIDIKKVSKMYGVAVGALIGDAFGMPVKFAHRKREHITTLESSGRHDGVLSAWNLPAGTFTDNSMTGIVMLQSILQADDQFFENLQDWADSDPTIIGDHTAKVLRHSGDKCVNTNGPMARSWPIALINHSESGNTVVIDDTIAQATVTNTEADSVWCAVFTTILIHKLVNGLNFDRALKDALLLIRDNVSVELYTAIENGSSMSYSDLFGGVGRVENSIRVVMWALQNTDNFRDAIISAGNVPGDTSTNACITGAIAGALYGYDKIPTEWIQIIDSENKWNNLNGVQLTTICLKDFITKCYDIRD